MSRIIRLKALAMLLYLPSLFLDFTRLWRSRSCLAQNRIVGVPPGTPWLPVAEVPDTGFVTELSSIPVKETPVDGLLVEPGFINATPALDGFAAGWDRFNVDLLYHRSADQASPDARAASVFAATATQAEHILVTRLAMATDADLSFSFFVRSERGIGPRFIRVIINFSDQENVQCVADLWDGRIDTAGCHGDSILINTRATSLAGGWLRLGLASRPSGQPRWPEVQAEIHILGPDGQNKFSGDRVEPLEASGPQIEYSRSPTSYVPVVDGLRRREPSRFFVETTPDWFNDGEGTFYLEWRLLGMRKDFAIFSLSDGSHRERITLFVVDQSICGVASCEGQDSYLTPLLPLNAEGEHRLWLSFDRTELILIDADTRLQAAIPLKRVPRIKTMFLGVDAEGNSPMHGLIRRTLFFPFKLNGALLTAERLIVPLSLS